MAGKLVKPRVAEVFTAMLVARGSWCCFFGAIDSGFATACLHQSEYGLCTLQ